MRSICCLWTILLVSFRLFLIHTQSLFTEALTNFVEEIKVISQTQYELHVEITCSKLLNLITQRKSPTGSNLS